MSGAGDDAATGSEAGASSTPRETSGARSTATGRITASTLAAKGQPPGAGRPVPTTLVSRVRPRAAADPHHGRPEHRRGRAGADRSGDRRARRPVRGGRRGAGPGRWPGARRDARPAADRPRLHHLRPARGHRDAAQGLGRRDLGHGPGLRHHRRAQGRLADRDHDVPLGDLRPVLPQAGRGLRRLARRRPGPPRLHRQRDGAEPARPRVRGPVRWGRRPGRTGAAHAGRAGGLVLRRPAADDAGRAVRRPARLRGRARGGRRDDRDGGADRASSPPSGSATSWSSWSAPRGPGAASPCSSRPGSRRTSCRSCRRWPSSATSTTGTRTSTSTP